MIAILRAQFLSMRWGRGGGQLVRAIPLAILDSLWLSAVIFVSLGSMWAEDAMRRDHSPVLQTLTASAPRLFVPDPVLADGAEVSQLGEKGLVLLVRS